MPAAANHYPKISVVTPVLNQAATLEKTILSVINQNYPNLEYIIMDGGSTDGSAEIIRKHEKHLAFWQSKPDKGQVQALNEGFSRCAGQICSWLNADDFYYPDALKKISEEFIRLPFIDLFFGDAIYLRENNGPFMKITPFMANPRLMGVANHLSQPSVFFTRRALEKTGFLDDAYIYSFDYDLWIRMFKKVKYKYLPFLFSGSIISMKCKTYKNWLSSEKEAARIQKRHLGAISFRTYLTLIASEDFEYIPHFSKFSLPIKSKLIGFLRFFKGGCLAPLDLIKQILAGLECYLIKKRGIKSWNEITVSKA